MYLRKWFDFQVKQEQSIRDFTEPGETLLHDNCTHISHITKLLCLKFSCATTTKKIEKKVDKKHCLFQFQRGHFFFEKFREMN